MSKRVAALGFLLVFVLALGLSADRAFVTNRGGSSLTIFDTTTNLELPGSPVTVGTGPIAIAADRTSNLSPQKLFVANSGSNTVSVVWSDPAGVAATISTEPIFGTLATPSGVALISDPFIGPAVAFTDQKVTTYPDPMFPGQFLSGRSTIRFINPATNAVVDAFQEPSATARYNGVVVTSNRRIWIADDGDQGVTVLKLNAAVGPPYYYPRTIRYQGSGEFADFVTDMAATPTTMLAPKRLATNGSTRVVVADGGSKIVTILDANYVSTGTLGEPGAVLANVDLATFAGAAPAFTCVDVAAVGNFAYVTTSNLAGAGFNCYQIDLTTFSIVAGLGLGGANGAGGLGVTSDGASLYVGANTSASGVITMLDISPSTDFTGVAPTVLAAFTGGSFPFAFTSSATVNGGGGGGVPVWVNNSTGVSTGHGGVCGLMGLEAMLLLAGLAVLRRS